MQLAEEGLAFCLFSAFDSVPERPHALWAIVTRWYQEYDWFARSRPTELPFMRNGARVSLRLACAPGCNHCCVTPISVIGPEAAYIADYIRAKFSDEQFMELARKINAREETVKGRQNVNHMCPLNVDGKCTIYEVRPFNCRKFHSFDESACRQNFLDEDDSVPIPLDLPRGDHMGFFWPTMSTVLDRLGFETYDIDFIPALTIALRTHSPVHRLALGESLFETVRWVSSDEI